MSTNPVFGALAASDPYEQLIASIIQFEAQPLRDLQVRKQNSEAYKSVLSSIDSSLSALHTLVKSFNEKISNPFAARIATVAENSPYTISAGDTAAFGSHSIRVDRLATTDQRVTQQYSRTGDELRTFFDANGAQSFSISVASPTDLDRLNRVEIAVSVDPVGTTNEVILREVDDAIDLAMEAAVSGGFIRSAERSATSVVNETSNVARLSIRSGKTGYANRLAFVDSGGGLLQALQLNSSSVVSETSPPVIPATAASLTGLDLQNRTRIDGSNNQLDFEVNGVAVSATLSSGNRSRNAIRDDLQNQLGPDVLVSLDGDALKFETVETGTLASIQVTGGTAVADLGLEIMASPVYGEDESLGLLPGGRITDIGTSETNSSLNAKLLVDGLTMYRSTNQIADAIDGVTIDLIETSTTAEEFVVDSNTESIRGELDSFIEKYNAIITKIKDQSFIDGDLNIRGALANDSTFRGLRFGLRAAVTAQVTGQSVGAPAFLGDLGIEIKDDGTLSIANEEKLTQAVKTDAGAVRSFFDGSSGIATRLENLIDTYVGTNGVIGFREDAVDQRIKGYDNRIKTLDDRLNRRETQLRREFARLQEVLASLSGQQQFLGAIFR